MTTVLPSTPQVSGVVPTPSIDDLDAAICRLARHMNAVNYRMLVLVREFDDRFGWAKWSFASCSEWLAWRCGIGASAAREKVRVAHALRGLPEISKAFEAGRISYSKVRALTRCADASNEQALLGYALDVSAAQVEERCRQIRNVQPGSVEEARRAWARRFMSVFRNDARGSMTISIEVPLDAGEIIVKAVDKAVRLGEVATGPEFGGDGWHAQQADALVAVARTYLDGVSGDGASVAQGGGGHKGVAGEGDRDGTAGSGDGQAARRSKPQGVTAPRATAADRYQIVVHVDEAALRGGAGRSELPIETVKRLACDCSITVVTENGRGDPLNVGRKHRIVPLGLRRALWSRDRGCVFPGCRHTRFLDAHHVRHWVHGGESSLENTVLLCTFHHRLVHEGDLRVHRDADGTFEFRRADGRAIPRCGYREEDAAPDETVLEGSPYTSAEAWMAALVNGRNPPAEVREDAALYRLGATETGLSARASEASQIPSRRILERLSSSPPQRALVLPLP
jgi:hypothetical protein